MAAPPPAGPPPVEGLAAWPPASPFLAAPFAAAPAAPPPEAVAGAPAGSSDRVGPFAALALSAAAGAAVPGAAAIPGTASPTGPGDAADPGLLGLAWATATRLAGPALLPFYLRRRAAAGKEDPARLGERRGEGAARPDAPLLWLHAASVGESVSLLPLLDLLAGWRPDLHFLVTTGTVTAADTLERRVPPALRPRLAHRYAPLDVPGWVARFLDGWRPDAGVLVESELWPNLLAACRARGLPMALVNGRLSDRSARGWRLAGRLPRALLAGFRTVLAQSEEDAARFRALGAPGARAAGNLKYAAPPLPADPVELARLAAILRGRPVLLAASTHPGEEAILAAAHARLRAAASATTSPALAGLTTIVVPRHPDRGAALSRELDAPRRSAGADPVPGELYLADTMGELGLFYRLAGVALVGGSLVPKGGQNPLEPARLGCPILLGPHTENFREVAERLLDAGGALRLPGSDDPAAALAEAAGAVLTDPGRATALCRAAAGVADDAAGLREVAEAVAALLPPPEAGGAGPVAAPSAA